MDTDKLAPLPAAWRLWHTDNSFEDGKPKDKYTDLGTFDSVQSFWKYCELTKGHTGLLGLNCGLALMRDGESPRWQEQLHRPGRVSLRVDARKRGVGVNGVNELVEEMFMLVVGGTMGDELIGASVTSKNITYVLHLWHEGNVESHVLLDRMRELTASLKIPSTVEYHPLY
jgi:hypothetical protein